MAPQQQVNAGGGSGDEAPAPGDAGGQARAKIAAVDALLDEIDDVLESNAETFVRGFVQKGGQ